MRTGVIAKKVGMTRLFQDGRPARAGHRPAAGRAAGRRPPRDGPRRLYRRPARRRHGQGEERRQAAARRISARPRSSPRRRSPSSASPRTRCSTSAPTISADHFVAGQMVDVQGVTQGKGFAGAMKRWGFGGLRATHGVSVSHRSHGSTGNRQDPGRVFKNKKMAGHMGARNRTQQNLEIVRTDADPRPAVRQGLGPGLQGRLAAGQGRGQGRRVHDDAPYPGRPARSTARRSRPRRLRPAWSTTPPSTRFRRCRATRKSPRSPPSRKPAPPPMPKPLPPRTNQAADEARRGAGRRREQGRLSDEGQGSDPRRARLAATSSSTTRFSASSRAPTSCTASSPGSSRSAAAPPAAPASASDVARTGKKFGRQKGGGTARHGDRRAPIFIGGGKAHGPRVRDFNPSLNKKVRALGLKMALSRRRRTAS